MDIFKADVDGFSWMNLQSDVTDEPNVVSAVGCIIKTPRSIKVGDRDTIDDRFDLCGVANDTDLVPNILVIRVIPRPTFGCVLGFRVGGAADIGPQPCLDFPCFIVDESTPPRSAGMNVNLRAIKPESVVVVPAANLRTCTPLFPVDWENV